MENPKVVNDSIRQRFREDFDKICLESSSLIAGKRSDGYFSARSPKSRIPQSPDLDCVHSNWHQVAISLSSPGDISISFTQGDLQDGPGFLAAWVRLEDPSMTYVLSLQPGHGLVGYEFANYKVTTPQWCIKDGARLFKEKLVPQEILDLLNANKKIGKLLEDRVH